ncbi:elongation factor 1-beta [Methanocella sp. CWC-04]|uniref:Elongation factor 1-beta n=1 Tax=Methanooceanicella nereidis TaxID=2052831 RepID=A0AAP2W6V5_9EURY|nr:elongation factor 1-beta [Methanocella sp. CWC-04]MCD1294644.1 elongation factor 1-beta [Methanocella sp. CWC-04]
MGSVAAKMRIMPDSADRDLAGMQEKLKAALPAGAELQGFELKPIAFGLKAIMATVLVGDDVGGTEAVEETWSKVEGVESITVEEVGRII